MKRLSQLIIIVLASSLLLSCDLEEKTDGEDACKDAAGEYLEELEDCLNAIGYTIGDPDDMADDYCEDECDDIDKKVKTSKVDSCIDEIGDMDCDELMNAFTGDSIELDGCEWMEDTLGC